MPNQQGIDAGNSNTKAWLDQACSCIRNGAIIAYPTEAVFGLGCDPLNQSALQQLHVLKGRSGSKGFIIVAANEAQLSGFIKPLQAPAASAIRNSWPGPVTWIVPCLKGLPKELTGGRDTLAVRISDHPVIQLLCNTLGHPLVSTSANRSGAPECRSVADVQCVFGDTLECIIDEPLGNAHSTSQIFDSATLKRLR